MQRYFAKQKQEDTFLLEEKDYHHIKTVMRMKENEKIEVVFQNTLYLACIQNVKENMIIKEVKKEENKEKNDFKITLFIPFLKEQKLDFIFQKSTELGVFKICLIPLERSVIKSKEEKIDKKIERWARILKEAAEQSKRLSIPEIEILKDLESLRNLSGLNLICSTKNNLKSIKKVMKNHSSFDIINVVIGPEGGLSPHEEETLESFGFIPVTLGDRIMRVETVPLYLMSILNYEFME